MERIFNRNSSMVSPGILIFGIILLLFIFAGCGSSDDEGTIHVCNWDNNEYRAELYRDSDDSLVKDIWLDEWHDLGGDQCEEFKDVDEGKYYIAIYEEGGANVTDRSGSFYLENGEYENFWIDSTGSIRKN